MIPSPHAPGLSGSTDLDLLDASTPGGVYLCHIGASISCGACCGLYNIADLSQIRLTALLRDRTSRFEATPRNLSGILSFETETLSREAARRPIPDFHHCPFLGLIGSGPSRVGCLLHPLATGNQGIDFRGLSHYGGMACRVYFCPTCARLPERHKRLLRALADDWYGYGLTVTETLMLEALFGIIESRLGRILDPDSVIGHPAPESAFRGILHLKEDWPFRGSEDDLVHDFFEFHRNGRPECRGLESGDASPYAVLLRELAFTPRSSVELRAAEAWLDRFFDRMLQSLDPV